MTSCGISDLFSHNNFINQRKTNSVFVACWWKSWAVYLISDSDVVIKLQRDHHFLPHHIIHTPEELCWKSIRYYPPLMSWMCQKSYRDGFFLWAVAFSNSNTFSISSQVLRYLCQNVLWTPKVAKKHVWCQIVEECSNDIDPLQDGYVTEESRKGN